MSENLHEILKAVQDGTLSVADAELRLKKRRLRTSATPRSISTAACVRARRR